MIDKENNDKEEFDLYQEFLKYYKEIKGWSYKDIEGKKEENNENLRD